MTERKAFNWQVRTFAYPFWLHLPGSSHLKEVRYYRLPSFREHILWQVCLLQPDPATEVATKNVNPILDGDHVIRLSTPYTHLPYCLFKYGYYAENKIKPSFPHYGKMVSQS